MNPNLCKPTHVDSSTTTAKDSDIDIEADRFFYDTEYEDNVLKPSGKYNPPGTKEMQITKFNRVII